MKKLITSFLLLAIPLLASANAAGTVSSTTETTWTDSNGITWSFTVNGTEATDIKPAMYVKNYLYGENPEEQPPFNPGIWDAASMRFSYTEGAHLPTIPDGVYFGLKTLIFDVADVSSDFDLRVMNAWWSCTYYDHVKWNDGLNELQITQKMADECAKGGEGKDLTLMLLSGSMTFNAVYYEEVSFPEPEAVIPEKVYAGSTELTVTSIGDKAFDKCFNLTSVTIPNSVTSIGEGAFENCTRLTSITIPNSVTCIGKRAFLACVSLTSVTIPNSVISIGDEAFIDCWRLTSITIPNSVISIGDNAFAGIFGLNSITIPNSVTSIGEGAFAYCWLTSVTIEKETPLPINESTFSNRANAILLVPKGCKAAYEAADYWKEFKEIVEIVEETITPITESEEINFSEEIDEATDLSNIIINNVYITVDAANSDGYDAKEQAIILNSTTSADQMNAIQDAEVGDASIIANYNGIIFELAAGSGTVTVDTKTIGTHVLMVQIGNNAPTKVTKSERGTVDVPFDVKEPTYVYLYASTEDGSTARLDRAPVVGENSVLLYGYKVTIGGTGIYHIENGQRKIDNYYDLNGRQVKTPRKGVYIQNGKKIVMK